MMSTGTLIMNVDELILDQFFGPIVSGIGVWSSSGITDVRILTLTANTGNSDAIGCLVDGNAEFNADIFIIRAQSHCLQSSTTNSLIWLVESASTSGTDSAVLIDTTVNAGTYRFGGRISTAGLNAIEYAGIAVPVNNHLNPSTLINDLAGNCIVNSSGAPLLLVTQNSIANTDPDMTNITMVPTIVGYSAFGLIAVDANVF